MTSDKSFIPAYHSILRYIEVGDSRSEVQHGSRAQVGETLASSSQQPEVLGHGGEGHVQDGAGRVRRLVAEQDRR